MQTILQNNPGLLAFVKLACDFDEVLSGRLLGTTDLEDSSKARSKHAYCLSVLWLLLPTFLNNCRQIHFSALIPIPLGGTYITQ